MTEEKLARFSSKINTSLDSLCTGCQYCLGCPKDIEIPKYMDAYNMYILSNKDEEIANRLKWHWGMDTKKAEECIACGMCEKKCTQHLPIIERLKFVANIK